MYSPNLRKQANKLSIKENNMNRRTIDQPECEFLNDSNELMLKGNNLPGMESRPALPPQKSAIQRMLMSPAEREAYDDWLQTQLSVAKASNAAQGQEAIDRITAESQDKRTAIKMHYTQKLNERKHILERVLAELKASGDDLRDALIDNAITRWDNNSKKYKQDLDQGRITEKRYESLMKLLDEDTDATIERARRRTGNRTQDADGFVDSIPTKS
jgi:hypothetical protein